MHLSRTVSQAFLRRLSCASLQIEKLRVIPPVVAKSFGVPTFQSVVLDRDDLST